MTDADNPTSNYPRDATAVAAGNKLVDICMELLGPDHPGLQHGSLRGRRELKGRLNSWVGSRKQKTCRMLKIGTTARVSAPRSKFQFARMICAMQISTQTSGFAVMKGFDERCHAHASGPSLVCRLPHCQRHHPHAWQDIERMTAH